MSDVDLSADQEEAFEKVMEQLLIDGSVVVLTGPAGTGKTTLERTILQELDGTHTTVLGAPTGKAAQRMSEVTGRDASTMHKLLYGRPEEEADGSLHFRDPHAPCCWGDRVILDEASMINEALYKDFQDWTPAGSSVLYIGDKEQLKPVSGAWGPDFDSPTAELTTVHRQALGNPILDYATWIREGKGQRWAGERYDEEDGRVQVYDGLETAADWILDKRQHGEDATLLCFTNKVRRQLNSVVRDSLGYRSGSLSPGDMLVVRSNHAHTGLMNGSVVTVVDVQFGDAYATVQLLEVDEPVLINLRTIETTSSAFYQWKNSVYSSKEHSWSTCKRFLHVHYGQCLTVHSSQGSQWENVGFAWSRAYSSMQRRDRDGARRLLYTAVTRAQDNLAMFIE